MAKAIMETLRTFKFEDGTIRMVEFMEEVEIIEIKGDAMEYEDAEGNRRVVAGIQGESILAWHCPKCNNYFEHDGKEHPDGILCPGCRSLAAGSDVATLVGVLQPVWGYGEPWKNGD